MKIIYLNYMLQINDFAVLEKKLMISFGANSTHIFFTAIISSVLIIRRKTKKTSKLMQSLIGVTFFIFYKYTLKNCETINTPTNIKRTNIK